MVVPQLIVFPELTEIIQKHTFVGIVDLGRCLSLLQHGKSLYLVNHGALAFVVFPICAILSTDEVVK